MNYDQTIQKAEAIIKELEEASALSMEAYKKQAAEAKRLLDACEQQLADMRMFE